VGVGGHDVNLGTGLLKGWVVVSSVFNFCGAIEGESGRHEDQNRPLAFEAGVGNFNELAVVESLCFERLNLRVDESHGVTLKMV
jgi:hypothetical protein